MCILSPKSPGLKLEDYVTTIAPSVRANGGGEYASGFVDVGGFGQTYVRNPNLNYIGFNGTLSLNLDNSVKKLFPNAGLQIFDSGRYAPTPPGFVNPSAGTSPSDINNSSECVRARGVGVSDEHMDQRCQCSILLCHIPVDESQGLVFQLAYSVWILSCRNERYWLRDPI